MEDGSVSQEELVDHEQMQREPDNFADEPDSDEEDDSDDGEDEVECPVLRVKFTFDARYVSVLTHMFLHAHTFFPATSGNSASKLVMRLLLTSVRTSARVEGGYVVSI